MMLGVWRVVLDITGFLALLLAQAHPSWVFYFLFLLDRRDCGRIFVPAFRDPR